MPGRIARVCAAAALAAVAGCGAPAEVTTVPEPTPSVPRRFADVTAPDFRTPVKVLGFDPAAASTVLEPIVFLRGADYCASFGVSPVDERCSREYVVEDSHTKVVFPLDPKVRLRVTRNGDADCVGGFDEGGSCPATTAAFAAAVKETPDMPARVTVRGGVVVELAQLYTP